jgi:hypothetical protein
MHGPSQSLLITSALKTKTSRCSEILASTDQTIGRFNPKEHHENCQSREKLKSHGWRTSDMWYASITTTHFRNLNFKIIMSSPSEYFKLLPPTEYYTKLRLHFLFSTSQLHAQTIILIVTTDVIGETTTCCQKPMISENEKHFAALHIVFVYKRNIIICDATICDAGVHTDLCKFILGPCFTSHSGRIRYSTVQATYSQTLGTLLLI